MESLSAVTFNMMGLGEPLFLTTISPEGMGEVRSCRVVLDQPDDEGLYPSDHFGVLAEIWLVAPPPAR